MNDDGDSAVRSSPVRDVLRHERLSELQSAEEASIRWLSARVEKGDRVTGTSPYIGLRLERELSCRGH